MDPIEGTDPNAAAVSTETAGGEVVPGPEVNAGATPAPEPAGINPAWEPIREVLGDDLFNVNVRPHLQKMDESAHTRITNLNTQLKGYEPYAPLVEQGVSPDDIQMAMQLRTLVETDPQSFYAMLGQHLGVEQEDPTEGLEQFGAGQENAVELPPHVQAKLDQFEQFQQQMIEQQQAQEQQAYEQQLLETATAELDKEMSTFLTSNPSFTEDDKQQLTQVQYELTKQLEANGLNRIATLEEAAAEINRRVAYYQQRGGAPAAPNTLPTNAGGNIPGQQPDYAKLDKQGIIDLVSSSLAQSRQQ